MTLRNMIGIFLTLAISCWALGSAGTGWAQDQVTADRETQARLDFRQAVILQQMASNSELENPEKPLRQAARLYQSYLTVHPESAAAANNLAKIYEQMGDEVLKSPNPERAGRYFKTAAGNYQKAVAAADSRQGLYLKNYAELLDKAGEWKQAKKVYIELVQGHPLAPALLQSMTESYARHGLGELAEFTWNLLDAGYVGQSVDISMNAIEDSRNESDKGRIELLTVVCAGLAQGTDDYRGFLESDTGAQIRDLAKDKFLNEGAAEVVRLYQAQRFDRSEYQWWARRGSPRRDPDRGLWPVDGFRALIRSLGSRAKRIDNLRLAEQYFRLSADLQEWEIDPVAVRALVQMYAEQNAYKRIDRLLSDYQVRLFKGKGAAYRESRVEKIFQYHLTLGELYALIERWGDSSKADSAIFQLEHARDKSMMLEDNSSKALPEKYQFTPQMVDILARGYDKTGQVTKGTELRIDQAERYQKAGDIKATRRVLAPVKAVEVPSALQSRYQNLRVSPEIRTPVRNLDLQRASIKEKEGSQN